MNPLNKFTELTVDPEKPPADTTARDDRTAPGTAVRTPNEKMLIQGMEELTGYKPQIAINAPDSMKTSGKKAYVDRETNTISLAPTEIEGKYGGKYKRRSRTSGKVLSHELSHVLQNGTVPQDSVASMFRTEGLRNNVPQDSLAKLIDYANVSYDEPYHERPQEKMAHRAANSLLEETGVKEGEEPHPTERAFRDTLLRLMVARKEGARSEPIRYGDKQ